MKKTFSILFCIIICAHLRAQLFTITETSAKNGQSLNFDKTAIVDINSQLTIDLNSNKLTEILAKLNKANPATTDALSKLIFILQNQQEIIQQLQPYLPNTSVNKNQLQTLSGLMSKFLQKIIQEPDIRKVVDSIYTDAFTNGYNTNTYTTTDMYVISRLSVYCNRLAASLQQVQGVGITRIQLIALLNTKTEADKKIHIENFDNYKEGAYYEVPRWVTSFSDNDIAAFNKASDLSKQLNIVLNTNFNSLLQQIPDSLNAYSCFSNLMGSIQNKINTQSPLVQNGIRNYLNTVLQKTQQLSRSFQAFQLQKNNSKIDVVEDFSNASISLIQLVQTTSSNADSLFNTLTTTEKTQLQEIHTQVSNCIGVAQQDLVLVKNIYNTVTGIFSPFHKTANIAQTVSGNAFSLTLGQLPAHGFIDLKKTGKRENGDEVVIKIKVQQASDSLTNNWQTLEQQTIELQQVNFYSETSIGVILASPIGTNSAIKLTSTFQFAPSGALLLKFGSRKSKFFNALNPGIGFLMSTPDFDLDGSPDVSYGGVLTLLKNIVSVGLSYNTRTNSSFWSFGLALPFTTLGLPFGGNVQTQK